MEGKSNSALLRGCNTVQHVILFLLMMAVTLLVFVQVVLRYVLHMPLMGIEEVLVFPTIWLYFLGAVNASNEGTQIVARVLEVFISRKRAIYLLRTISSSVSLIVICWLTRWGYDYFKYALRVGKESPTLYVPMIYAEAAVFVGLLLMTIYTAVQILRDYGDFRGKSEETEDIETCPEAQASLGE